MKKTIVSLWIFVLLLIGTLVLFYLKSIYTNSTKLNVAENGIFSFSKSDIETHNVIKLHGNVEFYYDTLLTADDFRQLPTPKPTGLIEIPGKWNNFIVDSSAIKGDGKGTYRFEIKVPEKGWYGLKITEFKSAYSLWVNNECLGGAGKVASNKDEMIPSRTRKEFYFLSDTTTIEVIIQASNFHHYKGGATETIIFGSSKKIIDYKNLQIGSELFILGILFILFIYHLALYAYRRKDESILYFSLLCLSMLLRLGYVGEKVLLDIASFVPWEIAIRVEYISFYTIAIFTVLFAQKLFPDEIPNRLVKLISYLSIGFILVVLFTPTSIFSYTPMVFIYTVGIASFYLLIRVFLAVLRARKYSISIFIGYFVFFIFSINDMLYYRNIIDTTVLMPLGLFVLTISQAYVLAIKTSLAHSKIEVLSAELTDHANELEGIVEKRTKVIQNQKEEIENQKNELLEKAEDLNTFNEQLISLANYKNDMTNMMVHDLKNPLNNIIGFTSLPDDVEKYKEIIHASGWVMQNLIQNILDVEKYESTKINLNLSKIHLRDLVNKAYDTACFMIFNNEIQFNNKVNEDQLVFIDSDLIIRVFSNILSNATKYGNKEGIIEVSSAIVEIESKQYCKVNIYNSGEPIPSEKIDAVFKKYVQLRHTDNVISYSTGIGLTFCRMAIEAHGGEIGALSGKEKGVNFWFTLPI